MQIRMAAMQIRRAVSRFRDGVLVSFVVYLLSIDPIAPMDGNLWVSEVDTAMGSRLVHGAPARIVRLG